MITRSPNIYWFLPPLALAISLVYSASRHESTPRILRHAARLTVSILVISAAATLLLLALNRLMEGAPVQAAG